MLVRLQKLIADAGIASRRGAETLITSGKVTINGKKVTTLGTKADDRRDIITVNGHVIKKKTKNIYIIMNKPPGYVTTMKDPEGRPIVSDLLKGIEERLYPVGRLDYDTAGLLLFTNDGETANKLTHPKHEIQKTYRVKIRDAFTKEQLTKIRLENKKLGFRAPLEVLPEPKSNIKGSTRNLTRNSWLLITIAEGKNRQIKKMVESVGGTVLKLQRISLGELTIEGLNIGDFRPLTTAEEFYLKSL